jgi:23S rRNA pseudouridine1911/1915/1917 synthase
MTERVSFMVTQENVGSRLDVAIAERIAGVSRTTARDLIDRGLASVNAEQTKPSRRLIEGDVVEVVVARNPSLRAEPEEIPLTIVYRDADLAIIDKPPGLVVHPSPGHLSGTLANGLTALFPGTRSIRPSNRPGIVHRLDKDTSGLIIVALSAVAQQSLQQQIASRTVERRYLALVGGRLEPSRATIRAPIGRDPGDRKRMAAHGIASRAAETSYKVLEYLRGFSLLEAKLHTGRTHQIRVHMKAIGHPLAGDRVYSGPLVRGLDRQFLHAHALSLLSPSTSRPLSFQSSLPPDLEAVLLMLRGEGQTDKQ